MFKSTSGFSPVLSVLIALAITLVALGGGHLLWQSVHAPAEVVEQAGISAAIPSGWLVQKGIAGEERVMTASNPLQPHLAYQILRYPIGEGMSVSEVVGNRNLDRALKLSSYRVLDQTDVVIGGRNASKIHFAYVDASATASVPIVLEGVDYYFDENGEVVVVSMEDTSDKFAESLPRFQDFVSTVSFNAGGAK